MKAGDDIAIEVLENDPKKLVIWPCQRACPTILQRILQPLELFSGGTARNHGRLQLLQQLPQIHLLANDAIQLGDLNALL